MIKHFLTKKTCDSFIGKFDQKQLKNETYKNVNRYVYHLSENNPFEKKIIKYFESGYIYKKIKNICKKVYNIDNIKLIQEAKIDFRKYTKKSFMDLHRDVVLTIPFQYEMIVILKNSSDSFFYYIDEQNKKKKIGN